MSSEISGKSKVLIVVEAEQERPDSITNRKILPTLKQAIASSTNSPATVQVVGANSELNASWRLNQQTENQNSIFCPLTLNLPPNLNFEAQTVYQACRDVSKLRQRVAQQLGYSTGDGCFWLPVVNTAKGPLYGEVIGIVGQASNAKLPENYSWNLNYYQPCHLSDLLRQQLYRLGFGLLKLLLASPATYLVQFGFQAQEVYFDRLWPFPAAPAIASISIQLPDLFACHWYCLSHLPISELLIIPTASNET